MAERLPVGVIGVGHLGKQHARIWAAMPEAELVGVFDTDPARAEAIAREYGTTSLPSQEALLERATAVSVCVPTGDHHDVARACFAAGVDALVEKPITATLAEADALVRAAAAQERICAVGHVERHNPAVVAAAGACRGPKFIEVHRLAAFTHRSVDIDVILDLMIHDIDIVLALDGSEVVGMDAAGVNVLTDKSDIANGRLRLASGCVANLTASRVSLERMRKIRIFAEDGYFSIDTGDQEVMHVKVTRAPGKMPSVTPVPFDYEKDEPLRLELEDFRRACVTREPPRVPAADGRRNLDVAFRILDVIGTGPAPAPSSD